MYPGAVVETGAAALLFAVIFLAGGHIHPLRALVRDRRTIISFGAGMSAAYVFVPNALYGSLPTGKEFYVASDCANADSGWESGKPGPFSFLLWRMAAGP